MKYSFLLSLLYLCITVNYTAAQSARTSFQVVTETAPGVTKTSVVATVTVIPTYSDDSNATPSNGSDSGSNNSSNNGHADSGNKPSTNTTAIAAGVSCGAAVLLFCIGLFIFRRWKSKPSRGVKFNQPMSDNTFASTIPSSQNQTGFLRELNEL
ncbi:hypothetical protein K7432_008868 [Basidiobolus ranarum]|uniref:Mid2 domain-containing protein n=1 Tax=Basidiobolus ranarum TaxID=34480 RepID=A0ABR2VY19_9FUNG